MNFTEFQEIYNITLNQQQIDAVQSVEGPVLLLAVPGSGKTTVLVTRLGYMVYCRGIAPERILTLTYTVAATHDMAQRFEKIFGTELKGRLEFRTINGICAKIISHYGRLIGKNAFELISDEKETARILYSIFREVENEFPTESDIKGVRTLITYIKNMMLTQEQIRGLEEDAGVHILKIYNRYREAMKMRGVMDYDDQMVYALNILKRSQETLRYFQEKYPYICVDEAQDTSKIQHEIIALLARGNGNLFMVGDEDQSIYGFRAAYPEALLSFEKNHPKAKVLLMEENFRSNARIVLAADKFIQKNSMRHEKHMKASREEGNAIRTIELKSRRAQYAYLEKAAQDCQVQTAVLYRDNESALPLIDRLERAGIPYRIRQAELTFFTHRVVQDIQNIIRFAMDPKDVELFMQIYYKINCYINKTNAERFCEISRKKGIPVLEVAVEYGHFPGYTVGNIKAMQTHLNKLLEDTAEKAVNRIVKFMGYESYLERSGMKSGKIFILKALASMESSAESFLERLGELNQILKEKQSDESCPFILSTIHASKGLEYDRVYLLDVADGIFPESVPVSSAKKEPKEWEIYEEERRIFYVGITRAKDGLNLFKLPEQSVFWNDLMGRERVKKTTLEMKKGVQNRTFAAAQKSKKNFSKEEYEKFYENLGEGILVIHKKFGEGIVSEMSKQYITIQFANESKKFSTRILFENELLSFKS